MILGSGEKKCIKKSLWGDFEIASETNKDFYGKGIVDTALVVMKALYKGKSPKDAWNFGMSKHPGHSGMSAAYTAIMVSKYSVHGDKFRKWCIMDDAVMVNWK